MVKSSRVFLFFLLWGGLLHSVPNKITLSGSSTVAPLASEIGKLFESKHPQTRVDVQTGGSSRGVTEARQGLTEIGMVSRAIKKEEQDLIAFTIARDGICLIVNKSNPISQLTDDQIVDIYRGKLTNWKAVGGQDAPITVVNKADGRSTLELFLHYFNLKASEIKAQVVIGDNQQGIKTVAGNPHAIGYVSIGSAEFEANAGVKIKLLPMAGVLPTLENIRNGKFPLSRPLNFVVKNKPKGVVKEFIEFALSKDVNAVIKEQYFVPISQ